MPKKKISRERRELQTVEDLFNRLPKPAARPCVTGPTERPNIRPAVRPHSECWRREWDQAAGPKPARVGDVRYCRHGKVQILTPPSVDARVQGPGACWWRDLSKLWDWKTYRLAVAALQAAEDF